MKKINVKLWRDLLANRWLFLAVTVVIIFGVALFESSLLAFTNLKDSYDYSYQQLHFADFTIQVNSGPVDAASQLEQVPGVTAVTGRANIDIGLSLDKATGQSLIVRAITLPSDHHPAVNDLKIESGNYLVPGDPHQVILEKSFAEYHNLQPGDSVNFDGVSGDIRFTVVGIATSPEYIFPAKSRSEFFVSAATWGVVFVPDTALPELTGNNNINEFCVLVAKSASTDSVLAQCQEKLNRYTVVDVTTRDTQPSNAGLKLDLQEFGEIADVFPILFLFVGAMTTFILITRIIQRQRTQLGLMRALGYSRNQMLLHYLSLSLIIGISGTIIGIITGYFLADTITHIYIRMLGLPYTITSFHFIPVEEGLFIGILPSLIAGIFPALAAARLRPAEAMRTPSPTAGRKLLLEKIFPFLNRLPLLWKMPLRNIFRNRRRSLSTVLGVVFGTVLILSSLSFIDSINNLLTLQFDRMQRYDARISFAQPMPQAITDNVSTWSGVKTAEPTLSLPATLEYNGNSFTTLVKGLRPDEQLYNLYSDSGQKKQVTSGQILLADALRKELDIKTGDVVSVSSPPGKAELKVAGFVEQPMGAYGYVTLNDAQNIIGNQPVITGIMLGADAGAIPAIRDTASRTFNVVSVEVTSEIKDRMMTLMNFVYVIMGVMLAFGAILSLMVVFTMITISLVERRREIATMRTLGEKSSRINGIVSIENTILGIVGLVIGIPLGYAITSYLIGMFQTDMFTFQLAIYARSFLLTALIIIIIMLVSEIPGIHSLSHLDLAKVTKEQVS